MHTAFGDDFAHEVGEFFIQPQILRQQKAARMAVKLFDYQATSAPLFMVRWVTGHLEVVIALVPFLRLVKWG